MPRLHRLFLAMVLCGCASRSGTTRQADDALVAAASAAAERMPLPGDTWPRTIGRIPAATLLPCARLEDGSTFCQFPDGGPFAWYVVDSSGVVRSGGLQLWNARWTPATRRALDALETALVARLGTGQRCATGDRPGARYAWRRDGRTVRARLVTLAPRDSAAPRLAYRIGFDAGSGCEG